MFAFMGKCVLGGWDLSISIFSVFISSSIMPTLSKWTMYIDKLRVILEVHTVYAKLMLQTLHLDKKV